MYLFDYKKFFMVSVSWLSLATIVPPAIADEGMWTYDNPPLVQLKQRYGFTPTQEWLDHLRLASVRLNNGGSGSFVSANGLVMTNHHVALDCIEKISAEGRDYVKDGYLPGTEAPCPDLELNVLQSLDNVTARVTGAVQAGASDKAARQARKAAMAQIEKQCSESTKQRCDVVTLYQDSEYWLYRYKKYTDVRLVFAPEQGIAFFGGNSGSPVVNQAGEVIGLIFDGNIENLGGDFFYKGQTDRALAVHANAITEALEKIYAAPALAAELKNGVPALAANDK